MDGDGGLPRYYQGASTLCVDSQTAQSEPPYAGAGNLTITTQYLNPFTNPGGFSRSDKHGTSEGHDIEILARGITPPPSSMSITIDKEAGNSGYDNDYRMLALRGPILLTGWGYDLQGKPI